MHQNPHEEKVVESFFKKFYNYLSKLGKVTLPIDYKEFLSNHIKEAYRSGRRDTAKEVVSKSHLIEGLLEHD